MQNYLAVMDVDPLAIEAHERADMETDTVHTITITPNGLYRIVKRSRVNNDLVTELPLADGGGGSSSSSSFSNITEEPTSRRQESSPGQAATEVVTYLPPGNRRCASSAVSRDGGTTHVQVTSTVETLNGVAVVCDTKLLLQEEEHDRTVLQQTLVITNQSNHKRSKTVRYFLPIDGQVLHHQNKNADNNEGEEMEDG
jgi:hypothetical protein